MVDSALLAEATMIINNADEVLADLELVESEAIAA